MQDPGRGFISTTSPTYKILMPPPSFKILMPPFFMPPPEDLKSLCQPTFMPPPKNLMPPRLCHPLGWHKKRGGGIKKKPMPGSSANPYGQARSAEFDGVDGTEYQKCSFIFFILCGYIDKVYTYLYRY